MKTFLICLSAVFLFSCNNDKTEAQKKAGEIASVLEQQSSGTKPDADGIYLKATIDGREWVAESITRDNPGSSNYRQVNGETTDYTISFQLWKPTTGDKREFNEDNAANLFADDGIFGGRKGQITVTKADNTWIEGEFYFTATSTMSDKKHEVTNGFFRIPAN
jgi:hypothetical protein